MLSPDTEHFGVHCNVWPDPALTTQCSKVSTNPIMITKLLQVSTSHDVNIELVQIVLEQTLIPCKSDLAEVLKFAMSFTILTVRKLSQSTLL